jgi:hypothetical protein
MEQLLANPIPFWKDYHAWIIGFLLIAFSSYKRFNIPPTSRSSTTYGRYHTAALLYMAVTILGWLTLAMTPNMLAYLGGQAKLDPPVAQFAPPLYAALVLTVVVASFKPFQKVDETLRLFFQELACIPWEAKRLHATLRATSWLPTQALQDQVQTALLDEGFKESDISFVDDQSPQALWTKVSALHDCVDRWGSQGKGRFVAFYYRYLPDFQQLSEDYRALAAVARRVFPMLDLLRSMQGDSTLAKIHQELVNEFIAKATRLEKDIYDVISRALLQCTLTKTTRWQECEAMGFVVNVAPDRMFDRLLLLYIMLTGGYIVMLSIAQRPWPKLTGLVIGTIYVGAILSALYPKRWPWARPHDTGRSIRGYVFSGITGFVFATVASLGLSAFTTGDPDTAMTLWSTRLWPWGCLAAFMAAATAYNMDNDARPGRRGVEATLQAVVGGVGALLVYWQLQQLCTATPSPACVVPPPARVILAAAVSGGCIGWLVPTWYREPQTVTVDYKQWKVIVTLKGLPSGEITPIIRVKRPLETDAKIFQLSFERQFLSAEEALASAIEYAREQIDVSHVPEREQPWPQETGIGLPSV